MHLMVAGGKKNGAGIARDAVGGAAARFAGADLGSGAGFVGENTPSSQKSAAIILVFEIAALKKWGWEGSLGWE